MALEEGQDVAPPTNGTTVVTSDISGYILAVDAEGEVVYYDDSNYFHYDVDPLPGSETEVVYSTVERLDVDESTCNPVTQEDRFYNGCIRQSIEVLDLTNGEVTRLYSRITPQRTGSEWHDVAHVRASEYLIADMHADQVIQVNTTTGITTWRWDAQGTYPIEGGGPYPSDWTHLNDVELLPDGRIMVSLRNQDQVVFIDRTSGVQENWTLGADGDHETLYEQHNPDYIPPDRGGPAVLIGDSENHRVVEYQRTPAGDWEESWTWDDSRLGWPRDADRLPNGHTLVSDTHTDRVFEVNQAGEILWTLDVKSPYEAERLDTGAESSGGPSAAAAELQSRSSEHEPADETSTARQAGDLISPKVVNSIQYTLGLLGLSWLGLLDFVALLVGVAAAVGWTAMELYWRGVRFRSPVVRV